MEKKGGDIFSAGYGTGEITITKLILYNLLFIVPIVLSVMLSRLIAVRIHEKFETTVNIMVQVIMVFVTMIIFFFLIPFIRNRESVKGVRYSLIGFLIVAVGLTLPMLIIKRNPSLFFIEMPHLATYILLTFIYCPEVLGMDVDISKWFKQYKQLMVILVYVSILIFYTFGFGWIFFNIAASDPGAFSYAADKPIVYSQYIYFSIITFATIGYGDITPVTAIARFLVSTEALIGAIVNVIFVAILFVYISNFQAFFREFKKEEAIIGKEEKMIKKEEKKVEKEEKYIEKLAGKMTKSSAKPKTKVVKKVKKSKKSKKK
ncbi:MAG: potassium channel family protein [Candidatus Woesearchaeota archaeon]|jgi:hypothetical protein|nr:potassium channel family protein [Candidatus Woesearchaeota archaeon]